MRRASACSRNVPSGRLLDDLSVEQRLLQVGDARVGDLGVAEFKCLQPGHPLGGGGSIELFNRKLNDELLDGEIFETLLEAKVLIEQGRVDYNTIQPHGSLGYRPPALEACQPHNSVAATLQEPRAAETLTTRTLT